MANRENLCKKHNVTQKQLRNGIAIVTKSLDKINDTSVSIALTELLRYGDISPKCRGLKGVINNGL